MNCNGTPVTVNELWDTRSIRKNGQNHQYTIMAYKRPAKLTNSRQKIALPF